MIINYQIIKPAIEDWGSRECTPIIGRARQASMRILKMRYIKPRDRPAGKIALYKIRLSHFDI